MIKAAARKSMLWSLVENFGLVLISIGSLILYSRALSPAQFGLFAVALATIELIDVSIRMLFHDVLIQKKDLSKLHFNTAFSVTFALSIFSMVIVIGASPIFGRAVQVNDSASVLSWMSLCFPFGALTATIVAQQRRDLSFKALALRSLFGRLAGALIGLALVYFGAGVWGLVAQQVLIIAVSSTILWITAIDRPKFGFGRRELSDLLGFGFMSVITIIMTIATRRTLTIFSGLYLGLEATGILNVSMRVVDTLFSVAATAVSQVALPVLASIQADRAQLLKAYKAATAMTCIVLYGLFIGLAALAPEVIFLMFGDKWSAAAPYVTLLASLVLLQGPRLLMGPLLTSVGRPMDPMYSRIAEFAILLMLVYFSKLPSLIWAIAILAIQEAAGLIMMQRSLFRAVGITVGQQIRGVFLPLLSTVPMVFCIWLLRTTVFNWAEPISKLCALSLCGALTFVLSLAIFDFKMLKELAKFAISRTSSRDVERS